MNRNLAAFALMFIVSSPAAADSLWQGDGNLYRLKAEGASRSFVVERPAAAAAALGWKSGDVLFLGRREANAYLGMIYGAGGSCALDVRGRVLDELAVVIDIAPNGECIGLPAGALELRFFSEARGTGPEEQTDRSDAEPTSAEVAATRVDAARTAVAALAAPMSEPAEAEPAAAEPVENELGVPGAVELPAPVRIASDRGSVWRAGDILLRLISEGQMRRFVMERPDSAAQAQGWKAGAIVFDGLREGYAYKGTLYSADGGCTEKVRGLVRGELTVILPTQSGTGCSLALSGPLELRFVGAAGTPLPADALAVASRPAHVDEELSASTAAVTSLAELDALEELGATRKNIISEEAAPEAVPSNLAPVAALQGAGWVPPSACVPEAQAQGLSLGACEGILSGLRLADGADPAAEARRHEQFQQSGGAPVLHRAVDGACYAGATLTDHAGGLDMTSTQLVRAEALLPLCLKMIDKASSIPAADRLAPVGPEMISGLVWVAEGKGSACTGKKVLRLTAEGLFQGRYGSEVTGQNVVVTAWEESADAVTARMEVFSEIVTAPDVLLGIYATRSNGTLRLTIDRQRVTAATRYTNAPDYGVDRIGGRYTVCDP